MGNLISHMVDHGHDGLVCSQSRSLHFEFPNTRQLNPVYVLIEYCD